MDEYTTLKLYNNEVQIDSQNTLWLVSGDDLDMIHNSLYATEFSGYATARIRILDGESRIINNIFGCARANANHKGLNLIDIDADDLTLDHNLYDANSLRPLAIGNLKLSGNHCISSLVIRLIASLIIVNITVQKVKQVFWDSFAFSIFYKMKKVHPNRVHFS